MKLVVATILEVAGILALSAGFFLLAPWLGVVVGGLCLVLLGIAVDPPARSRQ
jgi:hypothetical protein